MAIRFFLITISTEDEQAEVSEHASRLGALVVHALAGVSAVLLTVGGVAIDVEYLRGVEVDA